MLYLCTHGNLLVVVVGGEQCEDFGQWVHQVCALFNDRYNESGVEPSQLPRYTCPSCHLANLPQRQHQLQEADEQEQADQQQAASTDDSSETSSPMHIEPSAGDRRPLETPLDSQPTKRHRSDGSGITDLCDDPTSTNCHASTLPDTQLGVFIERQVKYHLREQGFADVAETISIRLV